MSSLRPINDFTRTSSELLRFLGAPQAIAEVIFSGLADDSREVESGDLFIALPGKTQHGATHIDTAIDRGAVIVLTDAAGAQMIGSKLPVIIVSDPAMYAGDIAAWFYQRPFLAIGAVGITGTNGKTTTATLIEQLWSFASRPTGLIGTTGIWIDGEQYPARFTTPQAITLQGIAASMAERHVKNMVMEVSSHALSQKRIGGARYLLTAFTNLTQDHLDYHGTMENYFLAKSKLFTQEYTDLALINIDDPYGQRLAHSAPVHAIRISRSNPSADWYYDRYEALPHGRGYHVSIRGAGGILIEGRLPLLGEHNLDNAILAIAIAATTEVDPMVIAAHLDQLVAPPGRLEPVVVGQKFIALVDYAHTPDAVEHALATARTLTEGKVIAVLGCGGDRDGAKRPLMGDALIDGSDIAIFTSDNPRSEDPEKILDQMMGAHPVSDNLIREADRRGAIAIAVTEAQAGDCIVLLGKGHEVGQEIAGVKLPFDDRIELARAIEELA